ncbi:hypothetical protein PybrP1_000909, partial [[Pythium] brassicae (nom. inval.)]
MATPEESEEGGELDDDTDDPLELSLRKTLRVRCFVGFETRTTTYQYTTQLTHSNVVSTVVTSRVFSLKRRQQTLQGPLSNGTDSNGTSAIGGPKLLLGSRNQDGAGGGVSPPVTVTHVYGQPCNPKKVRNAQNGKYQAQLPTFRRSLPSLPIPVARLNQELVQERDKFMAQLAKERGEKAVLENWAATKIQACYRGYKSRPRLVSFQFHRQLNSLRAIRLDLSDMRVTLKRTETTVRDADPSPVSPWRRGVSDRAVRKLGVRTRKERANNAATCIQACVKRFLVRFGYAHLLTRHDDEQRLRAVSVFRGFRLRTRVFRVVAKLQLAAVLQIQSLIRGIQARERFSLPSRTRAAAAASSLRPLYEQRQPRARLEAGGACWREEQICLRLHKVVAKLSANQTLLQRRLLAETLATPKRHQRESQQSQEQHR